MLLESVNVPLTIIIFCQSRVIIIIIIIIITYLFITLLRGDN